MQFDIKLSQFCSNLGDAAEKRLREKLPVLLTQEECGGYIALPPLPGVFPVMAAGMRDLAFVPITAIGGDADKKIEFNRYALVDSPFRERIAWTYLQIAVRRGCPSATMPSLLPRSLNSEGQHRRKEGMIAVDFFCGGGGLTRGLMNLGIRVVLGIDADDDCRRTYEHNNRPAAFL